MFEIVIDHNAKLQHSDDLSATVVQSADSGFQLIEVAIARLGVIAIKKKTTDWWWIQMINWWQKNRSISEVIDDWRL